MGAIEHINHRKPNLLGNVLLHVTQRELVVGKIVAKNGTSANCELVTMMDVLETTACL